MVNGKKYALKLLATQVLNWEPNILCLEDEDAVEITKIILRDLLKPLKVKPETAMIWMVYNELSGRRLPKNFSIAPCAGES
jgi:hypothetical protein